MITGFIDGTDLRNQDLDTIRRRLDGLRADMRFDNLTFYAKGDTERDRAIYRHVKQMGLTAGVMLQALTTTKTPQNAGSLIGTYSDAKLKDMEREWGKPVTEDWATLDYAADSFVQCLIDQVHGALELCPGMDYVFLEFEGVDFVAPGHLNAWYNRWAKANGRPDAAHVTYTEAVRDHLRRIRRPPSILWSVEYMDMARQMHRRNFLAVESYLRRQNLKLKLGLVYHMYASEAPMFPETVPNADWWLLPWHYWTFELPGTPAEEIADKKALCKELLARWQQDGRTVCPIGDVALGKNGLGHVQEFWDYGVGLGLPAYLGLGLPDPVIGVHWAGVEDSDLVAARALYQRLYQK